MINKNARIRQLLNGAYVAEIRCGLWPFIWWEAIDVDEPHNTWGLGSVCYGYCFCDSYEEAEKLLSIWGI